MSAPSGPTQLRCDVLFTDRFQQCEQIDCKACEAWNNNYILVTDKKIGHFVFENRVDGEPIDLAGVQKFEGWTDIDICKICSKGFFATTFEVLLEWGSTEKYERISEVCRKCLNTINLTIVRNKFDNKW